MIKVKVIGKDNVGWSIDKDRTNVLHFLNISTTAEVTESYLFADVYFFVWHDQVLKMRYFLIRVLVSVFSLLGKQKKVIAWITNDITKNNIFLSKRWPVQLFISPNSNISDFLGKHNFPYVEIPFFASSDTFKKLPDSREILARKLGIDEKLLQNKFIIGSFQRDSLGCNLHKPKWQKNPDLLIVLCKSLPKESYVLVLAGPRRHYLIGRCVAEGISYIYVGNTKPVSEQKDDIFINNLTEEKINLLYNLVDLYIVTSKSESGPKAVLEASLAGTLICSTDVGLARDFLHTDLVYSEDNFSLIQNFVSKSVSSEKIDEYKKYNYEKVSSVLAERNYLSCIEKALKISSHEN